MQGYRVEIFDLNGEPIEKLHHAIAFTYDRANTRVAVTALFPEPVCLRAVISYLEQKLPNGDFDIIVLSGKFLHILLLRHSHFAFTFRTRPN